MVYYPQPRWFQQCVLCMDQWVSEAVGQTAPLIS